MTELGHWFEDPADAPDFMLKMKPLFIELPIDTKRRGNTRYES